VTAARSLSAVGVSEPANPVGSPDRVQA